MRKVGKGSILTLYLLLTAVLVVPQGLGQGYDGGAEQHLCDAGLGRHGEKHGVRHEGLGRVLGEAGKTAV